MLGLNNNKLQLSKNRHTDKEEFVEESAPVSGVSRVVDTYQHKY
jgi:hypothetical protein